MTMTMASANPHTLGDIYPSFASVLRLSAPRVGESVRFALPTDGIKGPVGGDAIESVVFHALKELETLLDRIDDDGQAGSQRQDVSCRPTCLPPLSKAF